jgi:SecD/SecF fusion protein
MNDSINQTLSRTIITNLCTFFAVLALLFFGGETLRDFSLAMFIGMVAGTYSTIFIAVPIILDLKHKKNSKNAKK